jgi:hypothetical protein
MLKIDECSMERDSGKTPFSIHRDANLQKQLKRLIRTGGVAAAAARHAESIIEEFIRSGIRSPKLFGRLSRSGEARIKGCFKFDLVEGYRLIGIIMRREIVFVCAGTHDECDHWIRNNGGKFSLVDKKKSEIAFIQDNEQSVGLENGSGCTPKEDDDPFSEISQKELRAIFHGLCE